MFNQTAAHATTVNQYFFNAPFADVQQSIVNQTGYLGDILNGRFDEGLAGFTADLKTVFQNSTLIDMQFDPTDMNTWIPILMNNDELHSLMAVNISNYLPDTLNEQSKELITQLVHFMASPLSGQLIAALGPMLSPGVAALNSLQDIASGSDADFGQVLKDLAAVPVNMVGAFFNGASLNLDALLPAISGLMPEGMDIDGLSIAFGGLFSPGNTFATPGLEMPGFGGSLLNSVGISGNFGGTDLDMQANAVGPIAAMANMAQFLAFTLGWDGTGNPLADWEFPQLDWLDAS